MGIEQGNNLEKYSDWKAPEKAEQAPLPPERFAEEGDKIIARVLAAATDRVERSTLFTSMRKELLSRAKAQDPHDQRYGSRDAFAKTDFSDFSGRQIEQFVHQMPKYPTTEDLAYRIRSDYLHGKDKKGDGYLGFGERLAVQELNGQSLAEQFDKTRPLFREITEQEWDQLANEIKKDYEKYSNNEYSPRVYDLDIRSRAFTLMESTLSAGERANNILRSRRKAIEEVLYNFDSEESKKIREEYYRGWKEEDIVRLLDYLPENIKQVGSRSDTA
jgi:hypothetical protein